jgi:hypothetical protein
MGKMHEDEAEIDTKLARRLLCAQFPRWSDLPITRLASGGTVNAIFRVGRDLTVRLPLRSGGARAIAMEARLLPLLAPLLPLPIPEVVAIGAPGDGYPYDWAVHRWIVGHSPVERNLAEPELELVARDLAEFAVAIRKIGGLARPFGRILTSCRAICCSLVTGSRQSLTSVPWDWVNRPPTSFRPGTCFPPRCGRCTARPRTWTTQPGPVAEAGRYPWRLSSCRTTG